MANSSRIVEWALENSKKLSLAATRLSWVDQWLPGYFDYQVSLSVNGSTFAGRGTDCLEETAFSKAVAEALERAAVSPLRYKWGTAAYPDPKGAEIRAYWELLTIDRTLCHHFCRKRYRLITLESLKSDFPIEHLQREIQKQSLEFNLYELTPSLDARVVVAVVWSTATNSKVRGFVNGFGCSDDLKKAAIHAALESLRNAYAVFLGDVKPSQSLEDFKKSRDPMWHFWMAQTDTSLSFLREYLLLKSNEQKHWDKDDTSIQDVAFQRIETMDTPFPEMPLVIMQALEKPGRLLKPQFIDIKFDGDSRLRLNRFSGKEDFIDSIVVPHFYG